MSYYSDKETEKRLMELEKKIRDEYSLAAAEMKQKADEYFDTLNNKRYWEQYDAYQKGAYTKAEFDAWYRTQVERGEGYYKMTEKLTDRVVNANLVAAALINDTTPGIYGLNFNYEAYRISQDYGVDFQLFDEMTIKNLLMDGNQVTFQHRWVNVDPLKSYNWNEQQISKALTAGILQGKTIDQLSESYLNVMGRNESAAIRNARTSVTSAQNAGRMESYDRAGKMGIDLEKEWMSTLDGRTRDSHKEMDGERQKNDDTFSNGLMYPGDPDGEPEEVYNCRCTMRAILPEYNSSRNISRAYKDKDGHREFDASGKAKTMTGATYSGKDNTKAYKDWLNNKLSTQNNAGSVPKSGILQKLESGNIAYNKADRYSITPSKDDIINKLQGGDMTGGSCASLCIAYMGNIAGYDVTDYRGGDSQDFFSRRGHISDIFDLSGKLTTLEDYNQQKMAITLLKSMEEGKEYCLVAGSHASMVRNVGGKYEYLELQSATASGWTPFNGNVRYTLKNRFNCKQSTTVAGFKFKTKATLIESDAMNGVQDFGDILGYLNTNTNNQLKGVRGHVK